MRWKFWRGSKSRSPITIHGRYDAAQTTHENSRHWSMADDRSADAANTEEVRRRLRNRARYETANNSYCHGVVLTLAGDCIGTGPRLQMAERNDERIRRLESEFIRWSKAIGLTEKLRTMRMAKVTDGESFAVLTSNPGVNHPVKLDVIPVEADRVTTPFTMDIHQTDGLEFDAHGNVTAYHLLKEHPGDESTLGEHSIRIPAKYMIHWYRSDRPEQHRGIPELTPALPLFAQLRRYTLAVIAAAETAADFAAVIYTDAPANGEAVPANPFETVELEKRLATTLPDGWKLGQLKAEQPTTNYSQFKREILGEIGRSLQVPINVIAGDSSQHNYASGRLDHQMYHRAIALEQEHCANVVLDHIFRLWLPEYMLIGSTPEVDEVYTHRHVWYWDGFEHVDPVKESSAQGQRLANRTTTLKSEYARQGIDWEDALEQLAAERRKLEELGLAGDPESHGRTEEPEQDGDEDE